MKNLFLQRAEENFPEITEYVIMPKIECNQFGENDELIIDLGNHYVGYFSFVLGSGDIYIDAPVKLYVKFCETKRELTDDFSSYKGVLCSSWLQEEIVNIDFPGEHSMPRRYAARYIKIKVLAAPQKFLMSDFRFKAVTSADTTQLQEIDISDELIKKLDVISLNTLKNCMHRVFEDGPKRDRRLWIGDLRLEALANYYSFNNLKLVRRCLYLFAAADGNAHGFMPAYIYENPGYVSGTWFLEDYALLFAASVCDYYNHTKDEATFTELYPAVKSQMEAAHSAVDSSGIITVIPGSDVFIDWCKGLKKITALQGVYLYTLRLLTDVLTQTEHPDAKIYEERYRDARDSALKILYDKDKNAFINEKDNYQYSVHSAVWMILSDVVSGDNAVTILFGALNSCESEKPFTPYMHHYVVQAMIKLGMLEEAKAYIKNYWGGMMGEGADTFYEVYVPGNPEFSPYGDRMINSMCHAWSCTPAYFIRKYFSKELT